MGEDEIADCDLEPERTVNGQKIRMCCSKPQRVVQRTLMLRGADDVDVSTLRIEQHGGSNTAGNATAEAANSLSAGGYLEGGVHVTWDPPPNPNAFIVSYAIEYTRDVEGVCTICS